MSKALLALVMLLTVIGGGLIGASIQKLHDKAVILAAQQGADQAAGLEDECKSLLNDQQD
jgi:hypothetical protein